jgi:hypothetical protein
MKLEIWIKLGLKLQKNVASIFRPLRMPFNQLKISISSLITQEPFLSPSLMELFPQMLAVEEMLEISSEESSVS